jgi:hypothetical protein
LIDHHFNYVTSLKSHNKKGEKNLAYVCVVEDNHLNLTPLGKFVMPPPLFEKQVSLENFPVHVDMHGHLIAALCSDNKLILVDCMAHETIHKLDLDDHTKVQNVVKMTIFKEHTGAYQLVVVNNSSQNSSSCVVYAISHNLQEVSFVREIAFDTQVLAICVSAEI